MPCRQDWRSSTAGLHHYVHENPRRSDGRCSCETAPGAHASSGLPGHEEILEIQQTRQMISAQDRHPWGCWQGSQRHHTKTSVRPPGVASNRADIRLIVAAVRKSLNSALI